MGVDYLDFEIRIEKQFNLRIGPEDWRILQESLIESGTANKPRPATAGDLHDWVVMLCQKRGMKVPHSSWNRVKLELARVSGKSLKIVRRETLVRSELGFA